MPSFPQYDTALLKLLDAQAASILGIFAQRSYARVEPPILQPAELFLDRSGEEIRRRTSCYRSGRSGALPASRAHHSGVPHAS
jgi:hypothetical protein